jgi:hypothetical protein
VNAALELHDSVVMSVEQTREGVVVRLAAYVHRSEGRPGIDAGVGVSQMVDLTFADGIVEKRFDQLPCTLWAGRIFFGTAALDELIPIPTSLTGALRFEAEGQDGGQLIIRSSGLDVVATSEGVYVEEFPGAGGRR